MCLIHNFRKRTLCNNLVIEMDKMLKEAGDGNCFFIHCFKVRFPSINAKKSQEFKDLYSKQFIPLLLRPLNLTVVD